MQKKNWKSQMTNVLWKTCLVAILGSLLVTTMGCTHVPERKGVELWRIDVEESILYRVIDDDTEQVIPFYKNQKAIANFVCMDIQDYMAEIEQDIKRRCE